MKWRSPPPSALIGSPTSRPGGGPTPAPPRGASPPPAVVTHAPPPPPRTPTPRARARAAPAGRPDADGAAARTLGEHRLEPLDRARGTAHVQSLAVEDGDARRVVPPVLQPLQPLEDQADRVLVPHVPHDAAHRFSLSCRSEEHTSE